MLRFELLKIFRNKINLAAMILGYGLIAFVFFSFATGESWYDPQTCREITGPAAIQGARTQAAENTALLTDEYLTGYLTDLQSLGTDLNSDDIYMDIIRPNSSLFYYITNSYADINENYVDNNRLNRLDLSKGSGFYERRIEKIRDYLNMTFSFGDYTEAEKEYWLNKASQVEEPFVWGSKAPMSFLQDLVSLGFYLMAVLLVCLAPVFSGERENGAVQLLLTTKYGKTDLIRAKILAAMIFSLGYITLGIGLACGALMIYCGGIPEVSLPVQLWGNFIPYDLTIGQTVLLNFLLILLMVILVVSILMLTSAWTGSTLASMAVVLVLIIGPAFLSGSKTSWLYNHIIELAVVRQVNMVEEMKRFIDYRIGPWILDCLTMDVIVYTTITVICLVLIRRRFVRGCTCR